MRAPAASPLPLVNLELVLQAYSAGFFPMAESRSDPRILWVTPHLRGILPLGDFHVSRSLRRVLGRGLFTVRCDKAFAEVMAGCAEATRLRPQTWLNAPIRALHLALYRAGCAHSVECWQDGVLVGGLYGIALGGAFFGESMFSRRRDASKVALCHLVARLRQGGFSLLDAQFLTAHLRRFGAKELPCAAYRALLKEALRKRGRFQEALSAPLATLLAQPVSQTS